MDEWASLDYTRRVLQESLRLYPPVWLQARYATEDMVVEGCEFKRGDLALLITWLSHRHPGIWEQPAVFDPDRFLPEHVARRPRLSYYPFGAGRHVCIGEAFAMLEGTLILATLAQHFSVHPFPEQPPEPQTAITLRPHNGLPAQIRSRVPS